MTASEKENTFPSTPSVSAEVIASPYLKRAKVSAIDNSKHRVSGFNGKRLTEFSLLKNVKGGKKVLAYTSLATTVEKEVTLNEMAMELEMTCLYWLCKRELQLATNYVPLMNLCKDLGVDVMNALMVGKNAKYTSERFTQEALMSFKSIVKTPLICDLKKSPFYTVMFDETTDVSVTNELILYMRFLKNGKSSTHFLQMIEHFDGNAATIKSAIVQTLEEIDVPLEKMCALGSDEASVMLGRKHLIVMFHIVTLILDFISKKTSTIPVMGKANQIGLGQL
ncbi:unnamed protein product [Mytilus coruscus]|uniref:Uncharacterized protein n=1 Tax=Mytilus coruscus TaxID=42192 RepID=A0A6J8BQM0_MYTCO|nr:unnamed protein product [Mytilus coruscus]